MDYFVATRCSAERMAAPQLLKDFPLKPHTPVMSSIGLGVEDKVPVLEMPPRLPLDVPIGPRREPRSREVLHDRIREGLDYLDPYLTAQRERLQILDQFYAHFVHEFEMQICELTDTVPKRRSGRGRAPRIRWVTSERRAKEHMKCWHTLERPLHWILRWLQDVLRYVESDGSDTTADSLAADLEDCPAEFRSLETLIALHSRARSLIAALSRDEARGLVCKELNRAAFQNLLGRAERAVDDERSGVRRWVCKDGSLRPTRKQIMHNSNLVCFSICITGSQFVGNGCCGPG